MMQEPIREPVALLHTVPTHLSGDSVVSVGTLDLSARQVIMLLVGGSLAVTLWQRTTALMMVWPPVGLVLHWAMLLLLLGSVVLLTFGNAAGRSLDVWLFVWLAYLTRARILLWTRTSGGMDQQKRGRPNNDEDERKAV
jgi:hypothetical protein